MAGLIWSFSPAGDPDGQLVHVLRKHAGRLQWAASLLQPKISQAASLLPVMLKPEEQHGTAQADAGTFSRNGVSQPALWSLE